MTGGTIEQQVLTLVKLLVGAGLLSLVMPLFVSMIVQTGWPRRAKELTAISSCVIVAWLTLVATGQDFANIVLVAPVMAVLTQKAYKDFWKPSGIAPWIEQITTVIKPQEPVK